MMVLIHRGRELLLARSPHYAPGMFSALAGFVEPGESLEDCVHREVAEEVGVTVQRPALLRQPELALPAQPDGGLHRRMARRRDRAAGRRDRSRRLVRHRRAARHPAALFDRRAPDPRHRRRAARRSRCAIPRPDVGCQPHPRIVAGDQTAWRSRAATALPVDRHRRVPAQRALSGRRSRVPDRAALPGSRPLPTYAIDLGVHRDHAAQTGLAIDTVGWMTRQRYRAMTVPHPAVRQHRATEPARGAGLRLTRATACA